MEQMMEFNDSNDSLSSSNYNNFDIRIRNESDLLEEQFEQFDEDEEYDEEAELEYYNETSTNSNISDQKNRSRKQHLSTISRDHSFPTFSGYEDFLFEQDEQTNNGKPQTRIKHKTPLYQLNPEDFKNDPFKQYQIRRALGAYRHHQLKKGLLNKFKEENKKLKAVIKLYARRESKILEALDCSNCTKAIQTILSLEPHPQSLLTPTPLKLNNMPAIPIPLTLKQKAAETKTRPTETQTANIWKLSSKPKVDASSSNNSKSNLFSLHQNGSSRASGSSGSSSSYPNPNLSKYKPIAPKAPSTMQNSYTDPVQIFGNLSTSASMSMEPQISTKDSQQIMDDRVRAGASISKANIKNAVSPPKLTKTIQQINRILLNQRKQRLQSQSRTPTSSKSSTASSPIDVTSPSPFEDDSSNSKSNFDEESVAWTVDDFKPQDAYDGTEFDFVKPSKLAMASTSTRNATKAKLGTKVTEQNIKQWNPKPSIKKTPASAASSSATSTSTSSVAKTVVLASANPDQRKSKRAAAINRRTTVDLLSGNMPITTTTSVSSLPVGRSSNSISISGSSRKKTIKNVPKYEV